jgi:hypothetical protein
MFEFSGRLKSQHLSVDLSNNTNVLRIDAYFRLTGRSISSLYTVKSLRVINFDTLRRFQLALQGGRDLKEPDARGSEVFDPSNL